jgi:archaemetzincin
LRFALRDPEMPAIERDMERIRPLAARMRAPRPGDWLDRHEEAGQTFHEYLAANPSRVSDHFSTIYVQPIGTFSEGQTKIARQTIDMLELFYGMPVKMLEVVPLEEIPDSARRPRDGFEQLLTTYLLHELLIPRRPDDAAAVLGLSATDLWPGEGWNYVFGQASLEARVGVWSIARFGDPDESKAAYQLCLRRTVGVALHETGHMLGIQHCTMYACGMNGANHLEESDSHPLDFCPECTAKVWWACRGDARARYENLAERANVMGLAEDAREWKRRAEAVAE